MKTILLIKEIYLDGFKSLGNYSIKKYFEFFAWFSFVLFFVVLYAFIFRIATGFSFS